jgi:hypothetical protein
MWKKIKKNKIIIILLVTALSLIILRIALIQKPNKKDVQNQTGIKKEVESVQQSKKLVLFEIGTSQSGVYGLIDEQVKDLHQPFPLPTNLNLKSGKYTFQFFKEGYKTKTVTLDLQANQTFDVQLDEQEIVGDLYRIPSESQINSLGWNDNRAYYQSGNKLKEVRQNTTLAAFPTKNNIDISNTGSAVSRNNEKVYLTEIPPKVKELSLKAEQVLISPSGDNIGTITEKDVTIYDLNSNQLAAFSFQEKVVDVSWHANNYLGCLTKSNSNQNTIFLLNITDNQQRPIVKLEGEIFNFSFSPLNIHLGLNNKAGTIIFNLNGEIVYSLPRRESALQATSLWRNDNKLILIEKYQEEFAKDNYREIDEFSLVSPTEKTKEFITSSAPIPNKVNLDIKPRLSPDKNALLVAEKNGPLWLLILSGTIKDYMPDYKTPPDTIQYSAP